MDQFCRPFWIIQILLEFSNTCNIVAWWAQSNDLDRKDLIKTNCNTYLFFPLQASHRQLYSKVYWLRQMFLFVIIIYFYIFLSKLSLVKVILSLHNYSDSILYLLDKNLFKYFTGNRKNANRAIIAYEIWIVLLVWRRKANITI